MAFYSGALASELDLYVEKLTQDFGEELQAEGWKLQGVFDVDTQDGDFVKIDRIGARESVKIKTSVLEPIAYSSDTFEERLVGYTTFHDAAITDPDEIIRMAKDPTNSKKREMMRNFGRVLDRFITNKIEESVSIRAQGAVTTLTFANDGGTTINVNDNAFVTVGQTTGTSAICLTPGKVKKAIKSLLQNFVDLNDIIVLSNSNQLMLLQTYVETVSRDFRSEGLINNSPNSGLVGYLGLKNFIALDDPLALPQQSSNDVVYMMSKSALRIRMPAPLSVIIDQDPMIVDKPYRILMSMRLGAVRLDGKKIVKILCSPSVNVPA